MKLPNLKTIAIQGHSLAIVTTLTRLATNSLPMKIKALTYLFSSLIAVGLVTDEIKPTLALPIPQNLVSR